MFGKICAPVKITHYYIDTREDILHIAILQISPRTQTVPLYIHTNVSIYKLENANPYRKYIFIIEIMIWFSVSKL